MNALKTSNALHLVRHPVEAIHDVGAAGRKAWETIQHMGHGFKGSMKDCLKPLMKTAAMGLGVGVGVAGGNAMMQNRSENSAKGKLETLNAVVTKTKETVAPLGGQTKELTYAISGQRLTPMEELIRAAKGKQVATDLRRSLVQTAAKPILDADREVRQVEMGTDGNYNKALSRAREAGIDVKKVLDELNCNFDTADLGDVR